MKKKTPARARRTSKKPEPKRDMKECMKCQGTGSAVYGLGFIGALVYYITTAPTIWAGIVGFFKAIFWPAFVVYGALKYLGV